MPPPRPRKFKTRPGRLLDHLRYFRSFNCSEAILNHPAIWASNRQNAFARSSFRSPKSLPHPGPPVSVNSQRNLFQH